MSSTQHNLQSSQREAVLEHLLVGEILRWAWVGKGLVEVLRPAVDASGYDIVLECNSIIRHVQLKASHSGSSTARIPVNRALAGKPSGCVIWSWFDRESLAFESFLWFGGNPGNPLPSLKGLPTGKHSRGDATGTKRERPMIKMLPKGQFTKLNTVDELVDALFGTSRISRQPSRRTGR